MRYHCLAADYDGTLAEHGITAKEVIEALKRLKASTRKLILVTGRELDDLKSIFPEYQIFDRIVAENGAVLYNPATNEEKLLGEAPPPSFVEELRRRGVRPLETGKIIVATREPYQATVLEVIKNFGLERQVIFNKGAVMILPPGINKAKGLKEVLKEMHLSLHNTVAVGDGENDGAMFQTSECSVALANAIPALKEIADWVTEAPDGRGVIQLINHMLETDLAELDEKLKRHYICLGERKDKSAFCLGAYRSGILLAGTSKSGKTTMTTLFTEKIKEKGYQFCLIDPEGDYSELPDVIKTGDSKRAPVLEEIVSLLQSPLHSVVVCTLAIPLNDRPAFFNGLLSSLLHLRKELGHPHWLIGDEAHQLMPALAEPSYYSLPDNFGNFLFITTSPALVNHAALEKTGLLIATGKEVEKIMQEFAASRNITPGKSPASALQKGEALIWRPSPDNIPFVINTYKPLHLSQRHKKKYTLGDMSYNSFYFRGPECKLNLKAYNLMVFVQMAQGVDDDTWIYHLQRNDYSNWIRHSVHDEELADLVQEVEENSDEPASSRKIILQLIEERYTAAA